MARAHKRPNGRYIGMFRDTGGKQRSAGTYATEDEALARAKVAELGARPPEQPNVPELLYAAEKHGVPTIAAYGPLAIAGARLESTSRETYVYLLPRVVAEFGGKALDEVRPVDVRAFARKLDSLVSAEDMASSTAVHVFSVLRLIYKTAVVDFPAIADPATGISVSRKGGKEKIIATREQAKAVEKAIFPRYRLLTRTLFATGVRFGEANALKSSDIVQRPNGKYVIQVRRSVAEVDGKPIERKYGKTSAAQRDVPIGGELALEQIAAAQPDGRLFTNTNGGFIRRSSFSRTWRRAAEMAGVPGLTPHGARHSVCSWLASDPSVPLARVSRMMGHSSLTVTSAYVHVPDDEDEDDTILSALAA